MAPGMPSSILVPRGLETDFLQISDDTQLDASFGLTWPFLACPGTWGSTSLHEPDFHSLFGELWTLGPLVHPLLPVLRIGGP